MKNNLVLTLLYVVGYFIDFFFQNLRDFFFADCLSFFMKSVFA